MSDPAPASPPRYRQIWPTGVVGRRCLQFVLDRLIVVVPVLILLVIAVLLISRLPLGSLGELEAVGITVASVLLVLTVLATWVVDTWWPYRHDGQTPAMKWLGLRLVNTDGTAPSLRAYVVRTLMLVVDGFLWGLLGLVVMLVSEQHQRVGDMVAGTLVVRVSAD
ncbi:MAG TPA: RDD family protein [Pseudonocardiaceae bacterium]|jgi:uncharacterized RDD family membrane protein YckC|nr:RDD family protein [Pseudonocardiaceae bacterium]